MADTIADFQIPFNFETKGGFATEQTLLEVRDALTKTKRTEQEQVSKLNKSTQQGAKDVKVFGTSIAKMNPALTALETGFNALGQVITGATGLVRSIASADGSFESLGGVVDFAAGMIQSTFGRIPIVGGFFSATAQATAEITKLRLAFLDLQKETFQTLAATGFRLDRNLGDIIGTVLDANISIDQFNRIVSTNADGLRVFGGTIGNATEIFSSRLRNLTADDSELGIGLRLLGLGSNEIAEEFSDFIQANRNNARILGLSETDLNKALQDRIKSERVIAEITGISAQEQRQQQLQLATDAAFQAALAAFPADQRDVLTTFVSGLRGPVGEAAKQLLAFGTITDEQTALLEASAPGLVDALQTELDVIAGGARDADASIARILQVGAQSVDSLTELTKLGFLDPRFVGSLGEFFLQIQRSQAQLETFQLASAKTNKEITNQEELVAAVNEVYATQFGIAKDLAKDGKFSSDELIAKAKESGIKIDKETARIIMQAAEVEDAVGAFQSQIFDTLSDNFTGLADITVMLTDAFGDLLKTAGVSEEQIVATKTGGLTDTGQTTGVFGLGRKIYVDEDGNKFAYFGGDQMTPINNNILGGAFGGNTLSMVGEGGPELVRFGQMGEVVNNATTTEIMGAARGIIDAMASPTTTPEATVATDRIVQPAATVNNNTSDDILKRISEILNTGNMIQSNILKETKRSKGFQY